MTNQNNNSEEIIKLNRLPINQKIEKNFSNKANDWAQEILKEASENCFEEDLANLEQFLETKITIKRKEDSVYKNHLIVNGSIRAKYFIPCIKCLVPTEELLDLNFSACFLNESLEDTEEFKDSDTIFCDGQESDLYFFKNDTIDLKELVRELIFLNQNYMPLHTPDCKGLCSVCGIDLNHETCKHHTKN